MPHLGILFEIRQVETLPGEGVRVTGNRQELGEWNPAQVGKHEDPLQLRTGALRYPCWSMSAPVWVKFKEDAPEGDPAEEPCKELFSDTDSWQMDNSETLSTTVDDTSSPVHSPRAMTPTDEVQGGRLAANSEDSFSWSCTFSQASSPTRCQGSTRTVDIEYKYVKDLRQLLGPSSPGRFRWEDSIWNRRISLPMESGSLWLVSDAQFNSTRPPRVSRIVQAELVSRCLELDPDFVLNARRTANPRTRSGPPKSPGGGPGYIIGTPACGDGGRELPSFAIENEFEALADKKLPSLLADKLAAEKTANELAVEVMSLQRESSLLRADKERAEGEAGILRSEISQLKNAVADLAKRVEASSAEHVLESERLQQETVELQSENVALRGAAAELREENREIQQEMNNIRAALEGIEPLELTPRRPSATREEMEPHGFERRISQARSSLASATSKLLARKEGATQDNTETELMKVLRRRREKIQC